MSSVAMPGAFPIDLSREDLRTSASAIPKAAPDALLKLRQGVVLRRRGTPAQGRALEQLGHAIEYLVDSRLFLVGETDPRSEHEALQTLMHLSRAIFSECPEVISVSKRVGLWMTKCLSTRSKRSARFTSKKQIIPGKQA